MPDDLTSTAPNTTTTAETPAAAEGVPPEAAAAEAAPPPAHEPPKVSAQERWAKALEAQRQSQGAKKLDAERQELTRLKAEAQAERDRLFKLKESPIEALKELGWDVNALNRQVLEDGTPEALATKAMREAAEARKALNEYRQQQEQTQQATALKQAQHAFVEMVKAGAEDKYPHLASLYRPEQIANRASDVAREYHAKTGIYASEHDIAAYLEQLAEQEFAARAEPLQKLFERRNKLTAAKDMKSAPGSTGTKQTTTGGTQATAAKSKTLTNDGAAEQATLPPDFHKLTDKEQNALLVKQLKNVWGASS